MNPLPCSEVEPQIDLFAAGECDEPTCSAIREHLAGCPRCAEAYRGAQQLLGLLDLRFQEAERLERLRQRLAAEQGPVVHRMTRMRVFLRRTGALAAMLLVAVGLFLWLRPGPPSKLPDKGGGDLAFQRPNDFSQWSRTLLSNTQEARGEKMMPKAVRAGAAGETVVWAAPGAKWRVRSSRRIDLTAGKLFVRFLPVPGPETPGFQVDTPVAIARTSGAAFFIQFKETPPAAVSRVDKGYTKPVLSVTVASGRVQLTNATGKVTGSKGALLRAAAKEKPTKTIDRRRAPVPP